MKLGLFIIALSVFAPFPSAQAGESATPASPGHTARIEKSEVSRESRATVSGDRPASAAPDHYTLTPEKRARAIAYSRARYSLYFAGVAVSIGIYLFLWRVRVAVLFRDWARRFSSRRVVQCLIFVPVFLLAVTLLKFPLHYYSGFVLERRFGLSSQTFASWLADASKGFAVRAAVGVVVVWIFCWVVGRSPHRWWFYFWLATVPLVLAFILIEPYVIDPLFFKFTSLEKTEPALTARIETMLQRAGLDIPPTRIFKMNASAKTKTLDAYVTGVGPSKRVVIWDNTLRKMSEDETVLVVGHETGHYVLHHIPKEFGLIEVVVLGLFYLGYRALNGIVESLAARASVDSLSDLASLPVTLLVLTSLSFLSSPIINAISRHYELQADQFGIEVAYSVVADPNAAEARSLQVMGEEDLDDPDPNPFIKFWLYSHPPLNERIRFAARYKPWLEGKPLVLVHPPK